MSAIVVDDCDCALACRFEDFPVEHFSNERAGCLAWLKGRDRFQRTRNHASKHEPIERYFAVHVPRGHIVGVRP